MSLEIRVDMKKKGTVKKWDYLVFALLWCAYTATMLLLFHRQTVNYAGKYVSDMAAYVYYMQGISVGYEYPYPIMFWVGKVFDLVLAPEMAMAFSVTVLNSLTPLALKYYGNRMLKQELEQSYLKTLLWNLLLFAGLFVSMLFLPAERGADEYWYKGVFSPNPFHNATYLAARGFSVVSFFAFLDAFDGLKRKRSLKESLPDYLILSLSLLLTTMTKPSFTPAFGLVCIGVMVTSWLRDGIGNWKPYVILGIFFLPALADLLYQYKGVFTGTNVIGEEQGIGIGWLTAWHTASDNVLLAILLGLAFPLTVLLCGGFKALSDRVYRFSWEMFLVNLAMFALLYEKGFRVGHMNFAWGYMCGMFFLFVVSLLRLLKCTFQKKTKWYVLMPQWLAFALHLTCGMIYFTEIMKGNNFV